MNDPAFETIYPAFRYKNTAVVFETSSFFVPMLGVAIASLIACSSDSNNYDIIILSSEIKKHQERELLDLIKNKDNFSIRFVNPASIVKSYIDDAKHQYLEINYFRLSLPWILTEYSKILNLGADIVIERDVADLFNEPIGDSYYIAGGKDLGYHGRLSIDIPFEELDLKYPFGYVNADVLVFDLEKIRNDYIQDEVMSVWQDCEDPLRCAEQDAFNIIFDGKIQHFDLRWNLFPDRMAGSDFTMQAAKKTDIKIWESSLEDPYIIHFAAYPKPWVSPDIGYGYRWWYYARQSIYYEELLRRMCMKNVAHMYFPDVYVPPQISKERRILDALLPVESRRRAFIKRIISRDSWMWRFLKRIQYIFTSKAERIRLNLGEDI